MSKRFASVIGAASVTACMATLALSGAATGATSLPTLNVALSGTKGVSVSGSMVSGAVNVVSTFTGKAPTGPNANGPTFGLVRLNPGVSLAQAAGAVQSHHGDTNALTPYGTLFADAGAPGTIQTVLTPGNYVALNVTGNQPAFAPFTVTQSASPAALPAASATLTEIDFGFHGPSVLHAGSIVRSVNDGFLVHMNILVGFKNRRAANEAIALLKAGKNNTAQRLSTSGANLMGPASPGAMQQQVLQAKPGYYVEACFMNTEDGREHTQLGMERLVKVVK